MADGNISLVDKVCLVTGATRGLGRAAALELAQRGAIVILVGRNQLRIDETLKQIQEKTGNSAVEGIQADLSSMAGVRRAADVFLSRYDQLDVLINNVGATLLKYQSSPDGYEMTWALNYLGHFLITYLLLGALKSAAAKRGEARIVEVTSSMYRYSDVHFDRLQSHVGYQGVAAYAHSKRALLVYTGELARRLTGSGVVINAVTPGAVRTEIAGENGFLAGLAMRVVNAFALPPVDGVQPIIRLAVDPELCGVSGQYFRKDHPMVFEPALAQKDVVAALWKLSEEMTGLTKA